jgi:hypothetical protein
MQSTDSVFPLLLIPDEITHLCVYRREVFFPFHAIFIIVLLLRFVDDPSASGDSEQPQQQIIKNKIKGRYISPRMSPKDRIQNPTCVTINVVEIEKRKQRNYIFTNSEAFSTRKYDFGSLYFYSVVKNTTISYYTTIVQ